MAMTVCGDGPPPMAPTPTTEASGATIPSMRRSVLTVLIASAWLFALAQPASAHTVSGVGATNWKTTLIGVNPSPPGLRVQVVDTGSDLQVSNTGPEIVVLGYQAEPYLRVGPGGVFENLQSPSTYLNCSRQGCAAPPNLNSAGPPQWKQISTGHTARFHDHRIHWMGGQPPPDVSRAPGIVHERPIWTVDMRQGTTAITVTGHLTWIPGPSPFPWLLLAAGLAAVAVAAALSRVWGPALAVLAGLVTANDLYHAVGIGFSVAGTTGTRLTRVLSGSFYSIIGWVLGALAVRLLWRRSPDGLYAAAFAGVSAALFTGILDISVLSRSQAPFNGPMWIDRVTVAVSLGLGVGLAVGAVLALRRVPRAEVLDHDEDDQAGEDLTVTS
jgi:hypothetical protein